MLEIFNCNKQPETIKYIMNFRFLIGLLAISISCSAFVLAQGTASSPVKPPVALRPDIKVEHFMTISPKSVRLLEDPTTGDFYYTTFDGEVYQIKQDRGQQPVAQKIFTAQDHGITRLQGAAFVKNMLFLCGNISVNNNKGTQGRMVRYKLKPSGKHEMTEVFNTVEIGSTKTTFDHGFNGLAVSPDGKYIYVNSGARTDHGEVQDNGGEYPNSRNEALTAVIFRIPVDAKNLLLPNDEAKLTANGYLYAKGIRNAYDLAFDADGNLFGVSNSGDYDHPEDMFWIRQGHHYGFPWVMGGVENPQQNPNWQPNPDTDPFIPKFAHAWTVRYFRNDPDFPKKPDNIKFTPSIQNVGPDANEYRDRTTGKVMDGDSTGMAVGTFTPHASPLGLFFDTQKVLSDDLKGDGFVIRYSLGKRSSMMKAFTDEGADLLHLDYTYNKEADNYAVRTTRILEGFNQPTDALLIGNTVYVIEYGGKSGGNIWKITLPADESRSRKKL
jgi:glucose/arabinose dehydrogenase